MAPAEPGVNAKSTAIERLFCAGLEMHAALGLVHDAPTATLLHEAVNLMDCAIRRVRNQAFDQQAQEPPRQNRREPRLLSKTGFGD